MFRFRLENLKYFWLLEIKRCFEKFGDFIVPDPHSQNVVDLHTNNADPHPRILDFYFPEEIVYFFQVI